MKRDMNKRLNDITEKLNVEGSLSLEEYEYLIANRDEAREKLTRLAVEKRKSIYGSEVFLRGLIEISSICRNDCIYCGIRRSNRNAERYRLTPEQIWECADEGYELGFRTFVLQGGEDGFFTDDVLCPIIEEIKRRHPDCAVTLSLGERSRESYERLKNAGITGKMMLKDMSTALTELLPVIQETLPDGTKRVRFEPVPAWETPEAMEKLCGAFNQAKTRQEFMNLIHSK